MAAAGRGARRRGAADRLRRLARPAPPGRHRLRRTRPPARRTRWPPRLPCRRPLCPRHHSPRPAHRRRPSRADGSSSTARGTSTSIPPTCPRSPPAGTNYAWSGLDGLFDGDDLTVVNLECPVSDRGAIVPKQFNFRCDPAALPAAKSAGVDVANLANNHSGDYGPRRCSTPWSSCAAPASRRWAPARMRWRRPPGDRGAQGVADRGAGFGGVVPAADWSAMPGRPGMASGDDVAAMTAAVRAAAAQADLVFVTVHWGVELDTRPRPTTSRGHTR